MSCPPEAIELAAHYLTAEFPKICTLWSRIAAAGRPFRRCLCNRLKFSEANAEASPFDRMYLAQTATLDLPVGGSEATHGGA